MTTAGGYTIVAEQKDCAWAIYGPGQAPGSTPLTRVWGDPHVQESDGTRWDFSKSSSFRLPDGTQIGVSTTAQTGQSVTAALQITNGPDRVQISGIDTGKPQLGAITADGYVARAMQQSGDTFVLGGDDAHVRWFRQGDRGGLDGEVTGAQLANGSYTQTIDATAKYAVDAALTPPVGSEAWGNLLRDQALDLVRDVSGADSLAPNLLGGAFQLDDTLSGFNEQVSRVMRMFGFLNLSGMGRAFGPVSAR